MSDFFESKRHLHHEVNKSSTDNLVGIVSDRKVDPVLGPVVKVTYPDCDGKVSPWLQVQQKSTIGTASFHLPQIRERVLVQKFANGREGGIVTGAIYCSSVSAPIQSSINNESQTLLDGSFFEMNPDTGSASLSMTQSVQVEAGATIQVAANSAISINGGTTILVQGGGQITIVSAAEVLINAPSINANGMTIDSNGNVSIPGTLGVNGNVNFSAGGQIQTHLTNLDGAGGGA